MEIAPPPAGTDAIPVIRRALQQLIASGARKLRLAPGEYHLFPQQAIERFLHVANHDAGPRRIGFLLEDLAHLEIIGQAARVICHEQIIPFVATGCRQLTVSRLSIDWANPFFLQGRVIAVDAAANAFEIETLPECRAALAEGQLFFGAGVDRNREGWWQNIEWNYWIDPATGAAAARQPKLALWNRQLHVPARAVALAPDRFRLLDAADILPEVGSVLICKGTREDNRTSPAIVVKDCDDVAFTDVSVHQAGGMGLVAEWCHNVCSLRRTFGSI